MCEGTFTSYTSAEIYSYENNLWASHKNRYNNVHHCYNWLIKFGILTTKRVNKNEDVKKWKKVTNQKYLYNYDKAYENNDKKFELILSNRFNNLINFEHEVDKIEEIKAPNNITAFKHNT